MELGQGGHVVHTLLIHGVHRRHLLVGDCALLVGEHLRVGRNSLFSLQQMTLCKCPDWENNLSTTV